MLENDFGIKILELRPPLERARGNLADYPAACSKRLEHAAGITRGWGIICTLRVEQIGHAL